MSQESNETIDRTALELDDVGQELKDRLQYRYVQSQSSAESLLTIFSSLSLVDQHAAFSQWINQNRARAYELPLSPGDVDVVSVHTASITSGLTSLDPPLCRNHPLIRHKSAYSAARFVRFFRFARQSPRERGTEW